MFAYIIISVVIAILLIYSISSFFTFYTKDERKEALPTIIISFIIILGFSGIIFFPFILNSYELLLKEKIFIIGIIVILSAILARCIFVE